MSGKERLERIKVDDLTDRGEGIAHADGLAVFISGALPGDVVTAELTERKKNYARARLLRVDEASAYRTEPACAFSGRCGGCSFQELSEEYELGFKERQLREKLRRIAGLSEAPVLPIIPYEGGPHYRSKAVYHIEGKKIGFYERGSHRIVEARGCLLQSLAADAAAEALRRALETEAISALRLREMSVRTAMGTGEVQIVLAGDGSADECEALEPLILELDERIAEAGRAPGEEYGAFSLESVYWRGPAGGSVKPGGRRGGGRKELLKLLAGKRTIEDSCLGLRLELSPDAFSQTNHAQMEALYSKILEFAALTGGETVFDLYCGVGSIGLLCARSAGYVYGIELVKDAVLDANRNATINGIVNIEFICGRAEDETAKLAAEHAPDLCIVDPPRAGLDAGLLSAIAGAGAERMIYVSCDPGTLARDIKRLSDLGYKLEKAQPIDMFPRTAELETVCLLSRK